MTLVEFETGQALRIVEIVGGRAMQDRLAAMGIREGTEAVVVTRPGRHGPIVIAVSGSQFALGHGVASRVVAVPVAR